MHETKKHTTSGLGRMLPYGPGAPAVPRLPGVQHVQAATRHCSNGQVASPHLVPAARDGFAGEGDVHISLRAEVARMKNNPRCMHALFNNLQQRALLYAPGPRAPAAPS